jgi:hypothetical protein
MSTVENEDSLLLWGSEETIDIEKCKQYIVVTREILHLVGEKNQLHEIAVLDCS